MDGASKFVRGDAIAGLLITFINIIGGLIIGVGQMGVSFAEAAHSYTLLTVGDGLVSQIPALIVSTAAGLLVSKAGVAERTDRALFGQLGAYPRALAHDRGLLALLAVLPGLPLLPFLLAGRRDRRARLASRARARRIEAAAAEERPPRGRAAPRSRSAPRSPWIRSGSSSATACSPLIGEAGGPRLTDQIKALRRQLAGELGFVMPPVRIQDNIQLPANTYVIRSRRSRPGAASSARTMLLVMDPKGDKITLPGEETTEPTFGLPAIWVADSLREEASFRGYTVVDPATVLTTHLTEIIKDNLAELLSYAETQKLLDELPQGLPEAGRRSGAQPDQRRRHPARAADPAGRADLDPRSGADPRGDRRGRGREPEHHRDHRARARPPRPPDQPRPYRRGRLHPDPHAVAGVGAGLRRGPDRPGRRAPAGDGAIQAAGLHRAACARPSSSRRCAASCRSWSRRPAVRPYVRSIVERFRPATVVLSQNEIHPKARIRTLGQV